MFSIAGFRLRMLLALVAGVLVLTVVVFAVIVLVGALTGAAAGTSGDYGAVY